MERLGRAIDKTGAARVVFLGDFLHAKQGRAESTFRRFGDWRASRGDVELTIVRGNPAKTYEAGLSQRTVVTEWDSVEKAIAGHDSPGYQAALKALGKGAERDVRIVEAAG